MHPIKAIRQDTLINSLMPDAMEIRDKYKAAKPPATNCQNRVNGEKKARFISTLESIKQAIKLKTPIRIR